MLGWQPGSHYYNATLQRKGMSAAIRIEPLPGITISIEISSYPDGTRTLSQIIKQADMAMLFAKRCGKNNVQIV